MKKIKIIIDILMLILLILSFINWHINIFLHVATASLFVVLIVIHIFLNFKWLKGVAKTIIKGASKTKMKLQYAINIILSLTWMLSITMGIIAAVEILNETKINFKAGRMHIISAIFGTLFIVVHIMQHRKRLFSLFKKKKDNLQSN